MFLAPTVPEESSAPGAHCGRDQDGPQALLQPEKDLQRKLQGNHEKMCSKGKLFMISPLVNRPYYFSFLGVSQQERRDQHQQDSQDGPGVRQEIQVYREEAQVERQTSWW